jgi:hypothetical protein
MRTILSLFVVLCASAAASAQQPSPSPNKPQVKRQCCIHRSPRRAPGAATTTNTPAPSTPASLDFFVGEAKVDVKKDETVVRLAMAQHGSVLIELPANDGPRYIIPGDPEMATVDEKALERNKRAIVVRPGALFISPPSNRKAHSPAATVTVQMRSGLVVTFLFYPVEDLAQNVHRCVLIYNRDEVVARRRAAGLPVNLDTTTNTPERRNETGQSAAPISISVETSEDGKAPDRELSENASITIQFDKDPKPKTQTNDKAAPPPATADTARPIAENIGKTNERVNADVLEALTRAIKKPKQFKGWTKPTHGISLATLQQANPKDDFRIVLIAVKNTSAEALKISPGSPDLSLEMLDDQGKAINVQSIKKLHTEASETSGAIPAGSTAYYAVAFASPVLSVHQQVKVVVGQTNAADEPASITLTSGER